MSGKSSAHAALSHRSSPLDSYSPKKTFVPLRMPRALNAMSLHTTEDSPGHDRFWKVIGASSALLQVPFATHRKQTHTYIYIHTQKHKHKHIILLGSLVNVSRIFNRPSSHS